MVNPHSMLYVLHDSHYNMYKIGSSVSPYKRMGDISLALGYHVDLELATPGSDYFINQLPLNRTDHPIKHQGHTEWYHSTEQLTDFILDLDNNKDKLDLARFFRHEASA